MLRVGSENAMNDLIQEDEIYYFGKKFSEKLIRYKTFLISHAFEHVR